MITLSIDFLIQGIAILSIILICFCIYLTLERTRELFQLRIKDSYIKEREKEWYRYFRDEEVFNTALIPKNKHEIQAVEEIFLTYLKNLSNSSIKEKITQFSNQYLKQHYQRLLKSKKWSTRMNAMYRIVDFHIDSLVDECKRLEKRKLSNEENFQLLKIYSIFSTDNFLKEILTPSVTFSEYEYKKLLTSVNSEILEGLMFQLDELPVASQYSLIDTLGIKRNMDYLPLLESQLHNENSEIRIRSLKAINEIGIIIELEKYLPFVASPLWEERLMIAKLLGNLPLSYSYPYLQTLLQDESWWVRSQAAKTIGNKKTGREKLEEFVKTASDQYAVDMANEVLRKDYIR